ncbi:MAG: hypothetical protein WC650_04070 [Candidatus Doudnabacteria bacterium]
MKEIKYSVVLDFDGCCNSRTGGPGILWDLVGMAELAKTIAEVPTSFSVCLLTGRGVQYGFAISEALGLIKSHFGHWSGFEGGLIMAQHTPSWLCEYADCVTQEYLDAREILNITLVSEIKKRGGKQEKKEVCLTYNPPDGGSLDELLKIVQDYIGDLKLAEIVKCTRTNSAVDIWPVGGSKEKNILDLCYRNGVDPQNVIYVDDAKSGIPVFGAVGQSGAPFTNAKEVWDAAKIHAPNKGSAPLETAWVIRSFVEYIGAQ